MWNSSNVLWEKSQNSSNDFFTKKKNANFDEGIQK